MIFIPQALSVTLRERTLDSALRNVAKLKAAVDKCKATDAQRLRSEYDRLIGGLQARPSPFCHQGLMGFPDGFSMFVTQRLRSALVSAQVAI